MRVRKCQLNMVRPWWTHGYLGVMQGSISPYNTYSELEIGVIRQEVVKEEVIVTKARLCNGESDRSLR